ncbi:MAG: hypothetical protein GF417_08795 [Candidatus Latescibacteria bacterium]|nr:hypothetical protein [Candidatus Latescibacterota bacterium]
MLKNIITFTFLATFLSVLLISCGEQSNPARTDKSNKKGIGYNTIKTEDVGRLHNEILYKFNKRVPLLSNDKVDIDTFAGHFVNSVNEVFKENNLKERITKKDFALVLKKFMELKNKGVVNFFELPNGVPEKNIYNLADEGYFSQASADRYIRILKNLREKGKNSFIFKQDNGLLMATTPISEEADKYALFTNIAKHSYDFWDNLYKTAASDTTDPEDPNKPIKTMLWDTAGGLAGCAIPIPGASIVTGAAASIAYYEYGDDLESWIWDRIADLF